MTRYGLSQRRLPAEREIGRSGLTPCPIDAPPGPCGTTAFRLAMVRHEHLDCPGAEMRIAWLPRIVLGVVVWFCAADIAWAQTAGCVLDADHRGPDTILRCGDRLTIHAAAQTQYRLTGQQSKELPTGVELESGAVMIEFVPGGAHRNFQILTPHAIAAVRGTRWAVEVTAEKTSTLVISGTVEVKRRQSDQSAILHAGEGVNVSPGTAPIEVKRWKTERVRALLARFSR
jgi:ferric-dicitrate binding protein FerR (iron transport regulator)